jgi:phage terminase small subunit
MPNWTEVRKEYESSKITLKSLAEKYDVKIGTLKSRKSREGWSRDPTKKDATKNKRVATPVKKEAVVKKDEVKESLPSDELTDKQRLFCIHYIKTFNATQSAIKAGYAPESAHVRGSELVRNSKVATEIRRIKGKMTSELFIDAMDVLNKYVKIAFADITDYLTFGQKEIEVMGPFGPIEDEDGNVMTKAVNYVEFNESNMIDGSVISEVKQGKDGVSIKLADKMKALEKLSLYFDLFPDRFKREIEEEKLKIAHHKVFGGDEPEEYEDDGFEDALNATTSEVWSNDDSDEEEN